MTIEEKVLTFPLKIAPLIKVNDPLLEKKKITLYIKREDLIHPYIFGNKWYKLKYNLIEAERLNKKTILTFGGAYSNHIYAVSAAGKIFGFRTIGIIRGEEHLPLNPILKFAKSNGMLINYIGRTDYRRKTGEEFINKLHKVYGDFYLLPEGGTNFFAVKGCSEIPATIKIRYDYLCAACGTGGTISGLISGVKPGIKVLGFSVLRGGKFLTGDIKKLLSLYSDERKENWEMFFDYHFGGYAKTSSELNSFICDFEKTNKFKPDRIYFGKMLFGIYDLIKRDYFKMNQVIIALNSAPVE
jgi:1-aminocyclopropane-1-carboxylate deaminase/D-cysteine desulfhydrase-like pyridoxal-dependent ACC family enzyme